MIHKINLAVRYPLDKGEDQWILQLNNLLSSYSLRFFRPPHLGSFPCFPDTYRSTRFGIKSGVKGFSRLLVPSSPRRKHILSRQNGSFPLIFCKPATHPCLAQLNFECFWDGSSMRAENVCLTAAFTASRTMFST